jgi:DNA polymerase-3 subunit alpha
VQPGRYDPTRIQLSIGEIQYLGDIKDSLIQKLTIHLNADMLTDESVTMLSDILKQEQGPVALEFVFTNGEGHTLSMKPSKLKIKVTRSLMDFLQSQDGMEYTIND